ncbi:MAG: DMT family transporter [Candidatus Aenigmarchaeota archaeon]|nr:DMT family transporter [Candidatus Aenigmarchaeota archaeon]
MTEPWLLFAISFAFFHSVVSILDKILLKNKGIEPLSISTFRLGTNAVFALIIASFLFDFSIPSSGILYNIFLLSIVFSAAVLFYFIPMKLGDVSQLIPFREAITTFLSFVLAVILLSEVVSIFDLFGTLAIIVGSYILLTDGKIIIPKVSNALAFIAIDGILLAVFWVFAKPVSLTLHPSLFNFYMYSFVSVILFMINSGVNYKNQLKTFRTVLNNKRVLSLSLGASLSATIGTLSLFYGLTLGQAAEVLPITKILPVFVVLIGWLVLKEKSGIVRLIGSILAIVGVYLITI